MRIKLLSLMMTLGLDIFLRAVTLVIGGGTVGNAAARTALGMGADVTVLDRDAAALDRLAPLPLRRVQGDTADPAVLLQECLTMLAPTVASRRLVFEPVHSSATRPAVPPDSCGASVPPAATAPQTTLRHRRVGCDGVAEG